MKYLPINNQLFTKNRAKFTAQMKPKSIAVFNSNDTFTTGADSTLPFKQSSDLLYLSGADQEESILVLFPDAINPKHREILFLTETSKLIEIWYGAKYSKEEATQVSGIETIYWLSEFDKVFYDLMTEAETVYFNTNEHYRQSVVIESREDRFIKKCKADFPAHKWEKSAQIMLNIRGVKEPEEIELIQTACNITNKGFRRVLPFVKPGIMEYEIEAEYMHEFLRNRSNGFSYTPIIGSGYSACVLHYIENRKECKDGDMLLMDVGAEYANYSSDMTRTIPVNGRFTERQKQVYNAVFRVKEEATKMLVPGTDWAEYHKEVGKLMTNELLTLKLLDKADVQNEDPNWPAYKKYFMHGTSHHLGLDTHDYGALKTPMKANMVFTVEPGIYIPDENMGIRLEDDVVIQENGDPFNLMRDIPITVEEIEDLMNG
ncbi:MULTISPECIES: aminopeptidase P family protein [Flavobacteriaceae]|uniref:Xaa-Pro aminopeptidase n=2 Tax=Flavobacteriaceae TaxID=49546 RepID=A0A4Y8APL4_9FLAO|nr:MULTISPECIES: aminopeptidase P family protein [Flavobacteriaceae]TEW72562.1 aminopeptidase P family protein [Gramella jeungdoensis]GGK54683.1 Xaa-Pro aminopeptidase [Lutibacter litoralis]